MNLPNISSFGAVQSSKFKVQGTGRIGQIGKGQGGQKQQTNLQGRILGTKEMESEVPIEAYFDEAEEHLDAKEIREIGGEVRPETVRLPEIVKALGVSHSGATTPVVDDSQTVVITLPLTDDQIVVGLHRQIYNSLRWLAEWCVRQLKMAHVQLKKVHGKVMRISK